MSDKMVDITLHIDEDTTTLDRDEMRGQFLSMNGVMAATFHDKKPHLIVIEYDPETVKSMAFVDLVRNRGMHAELVGL